MDLISKNGKLFKDNFWGMREKTREVKISQSLLIHLMKAKPMSILITNKVGRFLMNNKPRYSYLMQ
jgi:hypothetical protein